MLMSRFIVAYVGPETILPAASVLAAILGVLLICWRFVIAGLIHVYRFVTRGKPTKKEPIDGEDETATSFQGDGGSEKPISHA